MGLYKKWTDEEIDILYKNNNKDIQCIAELLHNKSHCAIQTKMKKLGLHWKYQQNRWLDKEIEILRSCEKLDIETVSKLIPTKNISSIRQKANELGIILISNKYWSNQEDGILLNYPNCDAKYLTRFLPWRDSNSIHRRLWFLGLRKRKPKQDVSYSSTAEYRTISSRIFRYQQQYGIILNKDLLINTYDPIQWWKWLYYKTPNGEQLNNLPSELYKKDTLIKIIRYVVKYEMKCNTRDKILNLILNDFRKYKINFKHQLKISFYDLINLVFPEYQIKPFEMKNVPLNYWKDKFNCNEYLEFVLERLNLDENNLINQLFNIFNSRTLRLLGLNNVISIIYIHNHYKSYFDLLNSLRPEWNLNEKDFCEHIAFDGTKLLSNEELIIYELLRKLEIDIETISLKKSKYKFYNQEYDENYIPDFIIKNKNKNIIVEYFGLYRENYGRSNILKTYHDKTKRKIQFYNSLTDYYFLPIFSHEINNLSNLKNRVNNFLNEIEVQKDIA